MLYTGGTWCRGGFSGRTRSNQHSRRHLKQISVSKPVRMRKVWVDLGFNDSDGQTSIPHRDKRLGSEKDIMTSLRSPIPVPVM